MSDISAADIEALADNLSASANALHARLIRAIRQRAPDGTEPGIPQAAAQALFENEVTLRQQANGLYLDAAKLAGAGLNGQQQQLLDVTGRALTQIRKIERVKDLIALTGELLSLAAAAATGKPERLISPFEKIKHHLEELDMLE